MSSKLEPILDRLALRDLAAVFASHAIDDSLLADLTDEDLQKIGIKKLGHRKKLLAAFRELGTDRPPPELVSMRDPVVARREQPFVNDLGLSFVPIPEHATLFCIWQLRRRDYQIYCEETGATFPACDFSQTPDHPVVNVTWDEAVAFCVWLTRRERNRGAISEAFFYRLPGDREWSAAAGLLSEPWKTPAERSGRTKGYPWGASFPPPVAAGNYHPALAVDDFRETSPVGSFPPNAAGIYDLGGNVWEWCEDEYDHNDTRKVLRGASCFNDDDEYLKTSFRDKNPPGQRRNNNGFRIVLGGVPRKETWY